ncbi:MAG: hypothetical protein U5L45_20475 [Saprospiraceae bacterium]|nr:hypothetical protein [Saprospiraceae bacterium]
MTICTNGKPARTFASTAVEDIAILEEMLLLTAKPIFYVFCNVNEDCVATGNTYTALIEKRSIY